MQKLNTLKGRELEGVNYALFGCGNTDWTHTYQAVPKLCDALLQEHGATPLLERAEANAASSDFIDQFDAWEAKLWKELAKVSISVSMRLCLILPLNLLDFPMIRYTL